MATKSENKGKSKYGDSQGRPQIFIFQGRTSISYGSQNIMPGQGSLIYNGHGLRITNKQSINFVFWITAISNRQTSQGPDRTVYLFLSLQAISRQNILHDKQKINYRILIFENKCVNEESDY